MRRRSTNVTMRLSQTTDKSLDLNSINDFRCACQEQQHNGSGGGGGQQQPLSQLPDVHVLRRSADVDYTVTTMFSVMSLSDVTSSVRSAHDGQQPQRRRKTKFGVFRFLNKLPSVGKRRKHRAKKALSEAQLRKQLKKMTDRGNWDGVRKLISSHDFTDGPQGLVSPMKSKNSNQQQQQLDKNNSNDNSNSSLAVVASEGISPARRPSYGSRNNSDVRRSFTGNKGEHSRSFTGKESAAAAAAIKAALLDESEESRPSHAVVSPGGIPTERRGSRTNGELRRSFNGNNSDVRRSFTGNESATAAAAIMAAFLEELEETNPSQAVVAPGGMSTERRPSYGSRNNSDARRSFTGKESAAAAAAIKAAFLEELEESSSGASDIPISPDLGESILHDLCRCRPPVDVMELLLASLRHRRGITSGKDELGRTPLHVAAACGASPSVIDALTRADPCPASMADDERRSPLHLAVKYVLDTHPHSDGIHPAGDKSGQSNHRRLSSKNGAFREDAVDLAFQTVKILKNVMLTYPGKVDFKDEDSSGLSPLDYAIGINDERLIQTLVRRKEPRHLRSSIYSEASAETPVIRNHHSAHSASRRDSDDTNDSDIQDIDINVLRKLEEEEIEARKHRIEKIKARRQEKHMNEALYDVFGIEEEAVVVAPTVTSPPLSQVKQHKTPNTTSAEISKIDERDPKEISSSHEGNTTTSTNNNRRQSNILRSSARLLAKSFTSLHGIFDDEILEDDPHPPVEEDANPQASAQHLDIAMAEEDIYNHHLQSYLNDFDDDILGDLQFCDEDDFDFEDPYEEDESFERQHLAQQEAANKKRRVLENSERLLNHDDDINTHEADEFNAPVFEIAIVLGNDRDNFLRGSQREEGDDSCSHRDCVSEVTAPDLGHHSIGVVNN